MTFIPMLATGLLSFVPGTRGLFSRHTGGSCSARYCYSVWLRHLVMANKQGLTNGPPGVVAELGPGDSLGTGIAALISGSDSYYAFDAVCSAARQDNLRIFDELVSLFQRQEDIPDETEFPKIGPLLESYAFPVAVLTKNRLEAALAPKRLDTIRAAIEGGDELPRREIELISYVAPWSTEDNCKESSVDMIISQAVMEHVEDLEYSYHAMFRWLKPGGFMSHQIDFKCHNTASKWNGHWAYSRLTWACVKGRCGVLINRINRAPLSTHLALLKQSGVEIITHCTTENRNGITRGELSKDFAEISDEDLTTCGLFLQVRKS